MQRKEVVRIWRFLGFDEKFGKEISEVFLIHSVKSENGSNSQNPCKGNKGFHPL